MLRSTPPRQTHAPSRNAGRPAGYFVALVVLAGAGIIVYQLLWVINMRRGFLYLAQQPYNEYRMGNQIIRLQTRLRSLAIMVFIVCMIIYT